MSLSRCEEMGPSAQVEGFGYIHQEYYMRGRVCGCRCWQVDRCGGRSLWNFSFNHFIVLREVESQSTSDSEGQKGCDEGLRRESRCEMSSREND